MDNTRYIKSLCKKSLNDIEFIRGIANRYELLDEQFYLDYLDELNKLSIDQDR